MDTVPVWVVLVGLGLIGCLLALLWRGSDKRHDSHSSRLNDHEKRLATLEEEMRTEKLETHLLRTRWHEHVGEISKTLSGWFVTTVDYVRKLIDEGKK